MAELPSLNARKVVHALKRAGRTIKEPLLRAIIRDVKLIVEEFTDLL
jgi:hypothetical protein